MPRRDDVLRPGCTVAGGVLPPGEHVAVISRTKHVDVAVAIDIGREDIASTVEARRDRMLSPTGSGTIGVFEPSDVVVNVRRAEDIDVAVAIDIGCRDGSCSIEARRDVPRGHAETAASQRQDSVWDILVVTGDQEGDLAGSAHVRRHDVPRFTPQTCIGVVSEEQASVHGLVTPLRDLRGFVRCSEHVHVAVAVQIAERRGYGHAKVVAEDPLRPSAPVASPVLPPAHVLGPHYVG